MAVIRATLECANQAEYEAALAYAIVDPNLVDVVGDAANLKVTSRYLAPWNPPPVEE